MLLLFLQGFQQSVNQSPKKENRQKGDSMAEHRQKEEKAKYKAEKNKKKH